MSLELKIAEDLLSLCVFAFYNQDTRKSEDVKIELNSRTQPSSNTHQIALNHRYLLYP